MDAVLDWLGNLPDFALTWLPLIVLGLVAMTVVVLAGGLMFQLRWRRALAE